MREILFRGKRTHGTWVYGSLLVYEDGSTDIASPCWHDMLDKYHVNKDTIGQYTGLKDKNGTKIFEGDIVLAKEDDEVYKFEVKFGKCGGTKNVDFDVGYMGFYFDYITGIADYSLRKDPIYWINAYECEVVGNIYDNPELLKEE